MKKFVAGCVFGGIAASVAAAGAQVFAEVTTRGVLKGYIVQQDGRTVCTDPTAYPDFRGASYIICE